MKAFFKISTPIGILFIILGLAFSSCTDFLDVDEYFKNTTQIDSIFKRKVLIDQYIRGVASYLPNEGNLWTESNTPFQGASDENFTSFNDDRHAGIKMLLDEITPFYEARYQNYSRYYTGIRKASIALQRMSEVEDISDLDRRDFMGRCYFLKGYFYFQLLLQYGPVPILPEEAFPVDASVEEMSVERGTYDECVNYICSNLEKAAEYLYKERASTEIYIPTQGAALAVLSRVRLYAASPWFNGGSGGLYSDWQRKSDGAHFISQTRDNEKWGKAAVAAKRVIDLGIYELHWAKKKTDTKALPQAVSDAYNARPLPSTIEWTPEDIDPLRSYAEVFNGDVAVEMNEEIILSCQPTQSGKDCPAGIALPAFLGGMNGLNLTQDLVDAFYMEDGTTFTMPNQYWDPIGIDKLFSGYTLKGSVAKMYEGREMRFYATIGFNHCWWPASSYNGTNAEKKNVEVQYYADGNAGPPAHFAVDYNHTGYTCKKYVHPEDNLEGSVKPKSFPTYRYAEILLNYAEALNELEGSYTEHGVTVTGKDEDEILNSFNQVRYRAGLPGLVSLPSQSEMRSLIKAERRVEFICEGHRYHDLRRWGDADAAYGRPVLGMNIKAKKNQRQAFHTVTTINNDKSRRNFSYKHYFYPIPKSAMDRNNRLVQNPGY